MNTDAWPTCGSDYDSHDWSHTGSPSYCRVCHIEFPDWRRQQERPSAAAVPPPDRPAGLREALVRAFTLTRQKHVSDLSSADSIDVAIASALNDAEQAVLAALLASEPTGLDVERLARALSNAAEARQPTISADYRVKAEKIAAEYARLAETSPSDPVKP